VVILPPSWVGHAVRLSAIDDSASFQSWIGVSDVRSVRIATGIFWLITPWRFWAATSMLLVLVLAIRPRPARGSSIFERAASAPLSFLAALLTAILVFRFPEIRYGGVFNSDEAQMTAQAIRFAHLATPWRDVDGTTSGPLNSLVVAAPILIGHDPTLHSSRFIGGLLYFGTLVFLYLLIRGLTGDFTARLAVLLPLTLYCGDLNADYLQYASELLPTFLLAFSCLMTIAILNDNRYLLWSICAAGVSVGALPFAKLQAAPLAALLAIYGVMAIIARAPGGRRTQRLGVFLIALVSVPSALLATVAAGGAFTDFLETYVFFPRAYINGNCCHYADAAFFVADVSFAAFWIASICLCAICVALTPMLAARSRVKPSVDVLAIVGSAIIMVGAAIYAIEAPQTPFGHYTMLLIVPIVVITGTALKCVSESWSEARMPLWLSRAAVGCVLLISLAPAALGSLSDVTKIERIDRVHEPTDSEVEQLRAFIRPGAVVAMWGWMPQYLVYTGALMGTRDSISQFQIDQRPFQPYYRKRYLGDVMRNRPAFVLEAVGQADFAYHDRRRQGLANFPELLIYVGQRYSLVLEDDNVRLFERDDLIGSLPSHPVRKMNQTSTRSIL
jgi:hypothetical protein